MTQLISRARERMGEVWWWTLMGFLACRSGDFIQAFIGLWLVPHYVPAEELGAILPLLQIGPFWGIPLTIFLYPFFKYLNLYATRGEYGKVKTLLTYGFVAAVVFFVVIFILARFILPFFFERIRIAEGSLGTLTIATGLLCSLAPIYHSALQALKRFKVSAVVAALSAPVRLVVLLVTMPIRALSGYMLGAMVAPLLQICGAMFGLRRELGRTVKRCPIARDEWVGMLRYAAPMALNIIVGTVVTSYLAILFRQRLCDTDSATYYIISRLAEIGTYVGNSLLFVLFPLAAEAHARGQENRRLLRDMTLGTLLPGAALAVVSLVFGRTLLSAVAVWRPYADCAPQLAICTFSMSLNAFACGFTVYETACGRFGWLWYWLPLHVLEVFGLAFLTGYTFFANILPDWAMNLLGSINAGTLNFFILWILAFNCLLVVAGGVYFRYVCRHYEK